MIQFIAVALALLVLFSVVFAVLTALIVSLVMLAVTVGLLAVPLWFVTRHRVGNFRRAVGSQNPAERLQNLYVEGKIDLFEFERRMAGLLALER